MISAKLLGLVLAAGLLSLPGTALAQAHTRRAPAAPSKTAVPSKKGSPAGPAAGSIKPEDRARQMTSSMTQALGLMTEQIARVQEINLQAVQRVEDARRTFARQLPRMRAEIDLIGRSRLSLLKNVLTEQQFRAYATMREQKMGIPEALKQQAQMSEAAGGE